MSDPVNILLVDDQPSKLLSYEVILSQLGERLLKAGSASEALEQLLKNDVAVVLIDVCMPELDGFELARMIRDHPRFQRIAIIFVSAIAMTDLDRLRGYELGAVDYVPVPIVPELLRARVRVFADLYRKTRQLELLNNELERRVEERTAELAAANAELERRVEERTREREVALARMHEMQKLESLGQLTGGIAHDFNNLLMIVLSSLELVRKRVNDDPRLLALIDGAMQGAERGAALTRRMLAFARRQELQPESIALSRLIAGMEAMLRRTLGPLVEVATELQADLPAVRADPNQLELAVLNLAINARDAMPDGGRLTIAASMPPAAAAVAQGLAPGAYVCLSVADTGIGMDEVTLKRATEPFFTTKGVGKGTGLGLSMVHGLAVQSGGLMQIASAAGQGTKVELWLPVCETRAAEVPDAAMPGRPPPRSCRVLLVDDDPLVNASTAAMLRDMGHVVTEVESAAAALEALRRGVVADVLITDHAMPGMTGVELARQVKAIWPRLPVILATGYAEFPAKDEAALPRLLKPYRQEDVAAVIESVTGAAEANVIRLDAVRRA